MHPSISVRMQRYKKSDIAKIIERDSYVDDLLSGADNIDQAADICKNVSEILNTGCFQFRKFYSNDSRVLKHVENDSQLTSMVNLGSNDKTETLGLMSNYQSDNLTYSINFCPIRK